MKKIIINIILFFTISLYSQNLTKSEFDNINAYVHKLIHSTNSSDDIVSFAKKINSKDTIELKKHINSLDTKYVFFENGQKNMKNHIFPFYTKNENENKLNLTIYLVSELEDNTFNDISGLTKAKYINIIETTVFLNDTKQIVFENTKNLHEQKDIKKWFLKRFEDYLTITKPIHSKFKFIPPPPPSLPHFLENTPLHFDELYFSSLEKNDWKKAEIYASKLIDLYPETGRNYYLRAIAKYNLRKEFCNDAKKSISNGVLKEQPKLKDEINNMLKYCD